MTNYSVCKQWFVMPGNTAHLCGTLVWLIQHTCTLYGKYGTFQTFDLIWFHTIKLILLHDHIPPNLKFYFFDMIFGLDQSDVQFEQKRQIDCRFILSSTQTVDYYNNYHTLFLNILNACKKNTNT